MSQFCPYCGTETAFDVQFCPECGVQIGIKSSGKLTQEKPMQIPDSIKINSKLFDPTQGRILINWAFPGGSNATILNANGMLIGYISRQLSDFGIEYTIEDQESKEKLLIQQITPTKFNLIQNGTIKITDIEIHKVKSTIEIHSIPNQTEYHTEMEEFHLKKSFYLKTEDDDEDEIAELHKIKENEYPPNFTPKNTYTLKIKKSSIDLRKILSLALMVLINFKSNPYR